MRILFVAMANSVHTARWIRQLRGKGHELHLFPCEDIGFFHPEIPPEVKTYRNSPVSASRLVRAFRKVFLSQAHLAHLCRLIKELQPDAIHSMEIQHAGYLTLAAKEKLGGEFPPWIVTNWGSDIYHFGQFPEHAGRIRAVLANCDYYHCETKRDVRLGLEFGFKGEVLPVFPNSGGFDLQQIRGLRSPLPPSRRRKIMLKGYQGWAGRALVGLAALERCAHLLAGYELCIYVPQIEEAARAFAMTTGVKTTLIPWGRPHEEMLRHHGGARVSIGLSISDALSTSLLEAVIMGSFPVQSDTSGADELLEDGKTCLLVPPENDVVVAAALRKALTDDALVDDAAKANIAMAEDRLSVERIAPMAEMIYSTVLARKARK